MTGLRLYKKEKLCSVTAIERLFSPSTTNGGNNYIMAYPWRCVWRVNDTRTIKCARFLISVPKKRRKLAVDRVTMRRRMREAYRLHRDLLPHDMPVDMVIIYVSDTMTDYRHCEKSIKKIFNKISSSLNSPADCTENKPTDNEKDNQ